MELLLAGLAPVDRLLVTLVHLEGRSTREVQNLTGWSGLRIRGRTFRARRKLKERFDKLMEEKTHAR